MGRRWKKSRKGGDHVKGGGWDNRTGGRSNYDIIPKVNEAFEKYYKMQKICPEEEWDQMMSSCRENLPTCFRITGSKSEAKVMLHIIENSLMKDIIDQEVDKSEGKEEQIRPFPLPWYPEKMAWQFNISRNDIRRNEAYFRLHKFLVSETECGHISRQEAVSMIPPLALKVEPHHKVLDMCASPGSKTTQIIEMLHGKDSRPPEGYVVANDLDNKRCYMLVHQGKRLQSPTFIVTNHDAAKYPNCCFLTGTDGEKVPLKFDRVLCDVPCGGDGTIRKNIEVWKKWNHANSMYHQQIQYSILKRGMELLEIGGLLVYSTCSLNPQEDEVVIQRMLKEAKGSVELLNIDLPNLKFAKGLSNWTVCDKDLNVYEKIEDVPQQWTSTIRPWAFPPSDEEAASLHLDKCLRILPHQQNTGGFFIALLTKTKALPWEAEEIKPDTINTEDATKNSSTDDNRLLPPPPKKPKRMQGFKEEPYIFEISEEIWSSIKQFYSFDDSLKSTNFLRRSEEGKIKFLYLTNDGVRNFVINNENSVKIINVGVKALARIDDKGSPFCSFRLSHEGLPSFSSSIKGRRVAVKREDLILMLEQDDTDKAIRLENFSMDTQKLIKDVQKGSLVLYCDFQNNDGLSCNLELVGWKGGETLRVYVPKTDRLHYLRLCGADISKYEMKKSIMKGKESNELVGEDGGNDIEENSHSENSDTLGADHENPT